MARCVAHVHSEWSYDGQWPLSKLSRCFGRLGCAAVLMTEHDRGFSAAKWAEYKKACSAASVGGALLVPGLEYSDPDNVVHVLAWGTLPFLGQDRPTEEILRAVHECGGTAVLAHPSRKEAWKHFRPEWAKWLQGIEVWNRKTDGVRPSVDGLRTASETGLRPFMGLDFHRDRQLFPLTMSLTVATIEVDAVYQALATGAYSPRALGLPVRFWSGGVGKAVANTVERCRRVVVTRRAERHPTGTH